MKYKHRFYRIYFNNRWKMYRPLSGDWTIIGIQKWCASWDDYYIGFCFFGFELRIWFKVMEVKK